MLINSKQISQHSHTVSPTFCVPHNCILVSFRIDNGGDGIDNGGMGLIMGRVNIRIDNRSIRIDKRSIRIDNGGGKY